MGIRIKDSGQLRPVIEAAVPDKMDLPFRVLAADDATTPDVVITDHLTDELLDADSLTLLEIAVNVDYEHDLKLSEDEMGQIGTLGGAVALVQKRLALQAE